MKTFRVAMALLVVLGSTSTTLLVSVKRAEAAVPCAQYQGAARTQCLNAQVQSDQERIRQINQQNQRLDTAINTVCAARRGADVAANVGEKGGGAAAAMGAAGAGPVVVGSAGWQLGRMAGSAMVQGRDKCPGQ